MGRISRKSILYDGCFAHVFSRSIEKRHIFESDEDFKYFKQLLMETKKSYHFRIHHYSLLHTHFHLAVSMEHAASFSEGMKLVKWKYTQNYNARHKRRGPLWQQRFRSLLIEDEKYLSACGVYIENNAVTAGLAQKASDWPHSSSCHYEDQIEDPLVDAYGRPQLSQELNSLGENDFTQGEAIGSPLFKLYLEEEVQGLMPVP